MTDGETFDHAVDASWRQFRARLADHLAQMSPDDLFIVGSASADYTALSVSVDFWVAEDHLVCFARYDGLSTDPALLGVAAGSGWGLDGSAEPDAVCLDLPQRQADRAAAAAVTMLRDVAGVPHPCFAHARDGNGPFTLVPAMAGGPEEPVRWTPPPVDYPGNPDELRTAVARALEWKYGTPADSDEDGDFVLTLDTMPAYVLPHAKHPQVRILVPLLGDITGRTRAAEVLTDLNSQLAFVRLTLTGDQINAVIDVPGSPFSAEQFGDHLDRMVGFLETVDDRFAGRLGGRVCDEGDAPEPEPVFPDPEPELPAGLVTLLHLDPGGAGVLDAEQVAGVCGHDRDTILEYLRVCQEQVLEWQGLSEEARAADDPEEAAACDQETAGWHQTLDSLRAALRVVTLGPPRRPRQLNLFDPRPDEPGLFD